MYHPQNQTNENEFYRQKRSTKNTQKNKLSWKKIIQIKKIYIIIKPAWKI